TKALDMAPNSTTIRGTGPQSPDRTRESHNGNSEDDRTRRPADPDAGAGSRVVRPDRDGRRARAAAARNPRGIRHPAQLPARRAGLRHRARPVLLPEVLLLPRRRAADPGREPRPAARGIHQHLQDPAGARPGGDGRHPAHQLLRAPHAHRAGGKAQGKEPGGRARAVLRHREEQPGVRAEGAADEFRSQRAARQRLHRPRLRGDEGQRPHGRAAAQERRRSDRGDQGRRHAGGARAQARALRGGRHPQDRPHADAAGRRTGRGGQGGVRLAAAALPNAAWQLIAAASLFLGAALSAFAQNPPLERIQLPPGFRIEVLASVPNARSLALGAKGTLFVGSRSGGAVHAIAPGGKVTKIADGMSMPNGVAFKDGALYIGEVSRILKIENVETTPSKPQVVYDKLPGDVHHGWKFIRFGPDGKLYVPIGAPCNVCDRDGYALIGALELSSRAFQVFAKGIRNTVGFDWHPQTRELWFTDNGRDWLGDELPADELNHAPRCISAFLTATRAICRIPDSGVAAAAQNLRRQLKSSGRTWRRSACASTPARCSRRNIGTRSSSPNTDPGIARRKTAIEFPL